MTAVTGPARAQSEDGLRVHLDAAPDIILKQKSGREWIDVCFAPCDRKLDGDARYRIEGEAISEWKYFVVLLPRTCRENACCV
jgi:hypothetical protein